MTTRVFFVLAMFVSLPGWARATTNIVNEDFESYADTAAMQVVWPGMNGVLTADDTPETGYPGLEGKGAFHPGGAVSEYANMPAELIPSETQTIVLAVDIFDDGNGNSRMTMGMRNATAGGNILEMGYWNTGDIAYAYRLVSFWPGVGDTNWNFPILDPDFDANDDGIVNPADIANYAFNNGDEYDLPMWHRWEATITPDTTTITLDLFRDGLTNDPLAPENSVTGVDFMVVHNDVTPTGGFDSLRFGGASGLSSAFNDGVYDNITLDLIDVGGLQGDYNNNGQVEQDDLDLVLLNWGQTAPPEWENQIPSGNIGNTELELVQTNWGDTTGAVATATAVPEPASLAWIALGIGGWFIRRRTNR